MKNEKKNHSLLFMGNSTASLKDNRYQAWTGAGGWCSVALQSETNEGIAERRNLRKIIEDKFKL